MITILTVVEAYNLQWCLGWRRF